MNAAVPNRSVRPKSEIRSSVFRSRMPAFLRTKMASEAGAHYESNRATQWRPVEMLSDRERGFLDDRRVARLATADRCAVPHAVPVCFAVLGDTLYITIDEKPKRRPGSMLKRLKNIAENPAVAVIVDRYDEDWSRLGWVMLHGPADILSDGTEHDEAQQLLRSRYPQLEAMSITGQPVIAVRIQRATDWGDLSVRKGA